MALAMNFALREKLAMKLKTDIHILSAFSSSDKKKNTPYLGPLKLHKNQHQQPKASG